MATILALTTLWTLVVAAVGAAVLLRFRRRSWRIQAHGCATWF